jgi:hypothetical protein
MQGIWQAATTAGADLEDHVASLNMTAGRSVVEGRQIPYQPWAAKQKAVNFQNRLTADPLAKCYIPGVPRVMTLDYPFQIFQTAKTVTMAFEWELDYRLIYMDGTPHPPGDLFWMGDSRGHWDGDTLVVDVADIGDKTWLDMAGDFHSDALHVVERYRMTGPNTIQYEATLEDPKVLTKPFTIKFDLQRRTDRDRLYEYVCQAEYEEANGLFNREEKTWFPGGGSSEPVPPMTTESKPSAPVPGFPRTPDGKPDLNGFYESVSRGANQGLERRGRGGGGAPAGPAAGGRAGAGAPAGGGSGAGAAAGSAVVVAAAGRGGGGRGPAPFLVDSPDGMLPMQPWAVQEKVSRNLTERGYDDPTAHCFPPGVPRALYVPEGYQIVQTPQYVAFLHERVAWRIVPLDGRAHLPDSMRLWQGDSVGHWEGDTLVIDTANFNGKTWLNEGGEIVSHAEHVVERFTPVGPDTVNYEAVIDDPVVYTRPWTLAFPTKRESKFELREAACHEEDRDLPHLKALKDAAAAKKK